MRSLKYLVLASLVAFAACDEDTPGTGPETQTGTVNVTVTAGGSGVAGVTVSLGAAGTTPQTTDGSGQVSFANVPAGSYVVTISGVSADVVCGSTTQPVTVAGNATTAVTFACNVVSTASISGSVTNQDGTARANATVTITRSGGTAQTVTTGANGQFSLTGLRSGSYTVSLAATEGCTTAATTQTVSISAGEARVVNFVCTETPPPPPGANARVAIQSITAGAVVPGDPYVGCAVPGTIVEEDALRCRLNITVEVDEGDEVASRLEILLDGEQIYAQDFNRGAAAEGMALAVFDVTASVNTADFNEDGVPDFLNGPTTLTARLFTVSSPNTPAHTATLQVELTNTDIMAFDVDSELQAIGSDGLLWNGGDLTIRALPVSYSGNTVTEAEITVTAFGGEPGDELEEHEIVCTVDADGDFTVTISSENSITEDDPEDCNDDRGIGDVSDLDLEVSATSVTSAGEPGPAAAATTLRFDTRAPEILAMFDALRSTRWINESWEFDAEEDADVAVDDEEVITGVDEVEEEFITQMFDGVGIAGDGYSIFMAGSEFDELETVQTGADLPEETLDNSEYLLAVTVTDRLGNSQTRFFAGPELEIGVDDEDDVEEHAEGISEGDFEDLVEDGDVPDEAFFGFDAGNPEIDLTDGSLDGGDAVGDPVDGYDGFVVETEFSDDLSGFAVDPIFMRVLYNTPGESEVFIGLSRGRPEATSGTVDLTGEPEGYYDFVRIFAQDEAGNTSEELALEVIRDVTIPVVGGVSFDANLTPGSNETFQAGVFDNLDLNAAEFFLAFDGAGLAIRQSVDQMGEFGSDDFTRSETASSTISFIGTIQEGTAGAPVTASEGVFLVTDQAGNFDFAESTGVGGAVDFPDDYDGDFSDGDASEAVAGESMASDETDLCWDTDTNGCDTNEETAQVSFSITGAGSDIADGPLQNPFNRVVFYVGIDANNDGVIDVDESGNQMYTTLGNGSQAVTDDGTTRTYTWRINVSGAQLAMAANRTTQEGVDDPTDNVTIRAVGYNRDGAAFTVPDAEVVVIELERN